MAISVSEARGLFTKYVAEYLEITPSPTMMLKSFFKTKTTDALEIGIEVKRHHERIAVDVLRGANGNMNAAGKSTQKLIIPPYFNEGFALNELDGYDRIAGQSGEISVSNFAKVVERAATRIQECKDSINRRYELMSAQVLTTGIVTLKNGDNIDFLRAGASKGVLGAGNWWTEAAVDPHTTLEVAAKFIRTQGLYMGGEFNVILGAKAWNAFVNNPIVQKKNSILPWKLSDISSPIMFGSGGVLLGRVTAGSFVFNMWSYPQFYNAAGTDKTGKTPYIADEQMVVLPNEMSFSFVYGGVPRIVRSTGSIAMPEYVEYASGEFMVDNFVDQRSMNHEFWVKSAGVPIPTQVDAIYNSQVVA